jgi:hypothetical protein
MDGRVHVTRRVASSLIAALWVSTCAVAPEFIWQGLRSAYEHPDWSDFLSALLIGLILAFFVEPAMDRIRDLLPRVQTTSAVHDRHHNLFFAAALSLAFALTSVGLHDALTAFIKGHGEVGDGVGAAAGLSLAIEWAIVPFFITLSWQWAHPLRSLFVVGAVALGSPIFAGVIFGWPARIVFDNLVPCLFILTFGHRSLMQQAETEGFFRCARVVAVVGTIWILSALLIDVLLRSLFAVSFQLYNISEVFSDMRFYLGWALGLLLTPSHKSEGIAAADN